MREREASAFGDSYDKKNFYDEISFVENRMNSEGFRHFSVVAGNKYETKDREGNILTIYSYNEVVPKETPYILAAWYLFAIQNQTLVGYLAAHIEGCHDDEGFFCTGKTSYSVVREKGMGVGGSMERINDQKMQRWANENGDFERIEIDSNREKIELRLSIEDVSQKTINEMLLSRWLWLELYGPNKKSGFLKKGNYEIIKTYKQGNLLPKINMQVSPNDLPIKNIATLIRKTL